MPDMDPIKCAIHAAKLEELGVDMKEVKIKLFGNGRPGLAYLAEANAIWLKVVAAMCGAMLCALIPLCFKVLFRF